MVPSQTVAVTVKNKESRHPEAEAKHKKSVRQKL